MHTRMTAYAGRLLWLLVTIAAPVRAEEVVTVPTRDGVTQSFILIKADKPVAAVVLLSGGNGDIDLSASGPGKPNNFLVRSRALFAEQGMVVAVPDVSSEYKAYPDKLTGRRTSEAHAQDIRAVIDYLRKQTHLPVWVVGTSRGTISAVNAAVRLGKQGPDGIVLTSTVTKTNKWLAATVYDVDLSRVTVPVLVVHNESDGCRLSPFDGLNRLKGKLDRAPKVEFVTYHGGDAPRSAPCQALSYHGFLGLEPRVVRGITDWIKAQK